MHAVLVMPRAGAHSWTRAALLDRRLGAWLPARVAVAAALLQLVALRGASSPGATAGRLVPPCLHARRKVRWGSTAGAPSGRAAMARKLRCAGFRASVVTHMYIHG